MAWMALLMSGCVRRRTLAVRGDTGGNSWSFSWRAAESRNDGGSWSGTTTWGRWMVAASAKVRSHSSRATRAGVSSRSCPSEEWGEEMEDSLDTWSDIYLWMGQAHSW